MKANPLKSKPALLAAIGLVALGMLAYAATTVIVAVGTIPHSDLFDEPCHCNAPNNQFCSRRSGRLALSPWASLQCRNAGHRGPWRMDVARSNHSPLDRPLRRVAGYIPRPRISALRQLSAPDVRCPEGIPTHVNIPKQ